VAGLVGFAGCPSLGGEEANLSPYPPQSLASTSVTVINSTGSKAQAQMLQQEGAEVVRLGSAGKQHMIFVKDLQATSLLPLCIERQKPGHQAHLKLR